MEKWTSMTPLCSLSLSSFTSAYAPPLVAGSVASAYSNAPLPSENPP